MCKCVRGGSGSASGSASASASGSGSGVITEAWSSFEQSLSGSQDRNSFSEYTLHTCS